MSVAANEGGVGLGVGVGVEGAGVLCHGRVIAPILNKGRDIWGRR